MIFQNSFPKVDFPISNRDRKIRNWNFGIKASLFIPSFLLDFLLTCDLGGLMLRDQRSLKRRYSMEKAGYSYYLSEFKILLNTVKEREDWDEATKGRFLCEVIRLAGRGWSKLEEEIDPLGYTE